MKSFARCLLCFCIAWSALARTITSTSRQFTAIGEGGFILPTADPRPGLVTLEPEFLAVSAERIKTALLSELNLSDRYQGRVQIMIRPVGPDAMPIGIISTHYADGWQYRFEVPQRVYEKKLVTGLVEVLLTEMANRTPGSHKAELPAWVVYGLTEQLLFKVGPTFIARRNMDIGMKSQKTGLSIGRFTGPSVWQNGTNDPMRYTREILRTNAPLTFRELTSVPPGAFSSPRGLVYAASAHVLIKELLRLDPQRKHFNNFLGNLTRTWNWQTAFYASYQSWFPKPLDAEKWWSLVLLDFIGQRQAINWDTAYTMRHLESLLLTSAEVRTGTNDLPHRASLRIPELVRTWRVAEQMEALRPKVASLAALEFRANPFVVELVHDYKNAIQNYLDQVEGKSASPGQRNDVQQRLRVAGIEFLRTIEVLDARREKLLKTASSKVAAR